MRFFEPKGRKFLEAMYELQHRAFIDIGCGEGHIVEYLNQHGLNCLGIDILSECSSIKGIMPLDATTFIYANGMIPLVCRPCPGTWYFEAIDKAMIAGVKHCVYVGVDRNRDRDIKEFKKKYEVTLLAEQIGEDDESIYKIGHKMSDNNDDLVKFCLVKDRNSKLYYKGKPFWYEDGGKDWINYRGGRMPKRQDDEVLKTQLAECEADLDWEGTSLYGTWEEHECGWLSPEGKFYGCMYSAHEGVAQLIIKKRSYQAEELGWVHITDKNHWTCSKELTQPQIDFMFDKGMEKDRLAAARLFSERYDIPSGEDML